MIQFTTDAYLPLNNVCGGIYLYSVYIAYNYSAVLLFPGSSSSPSTRVVASLADRHLGRGLASMLEATTTRVHAVVTLFLPRILAEHWSVRSSRPYPDSIQPDTSVIAQNMSLLQATFPQIPSVYGSPQSRDLLSSVTRTNVPARKLTARCDMAGDSVALRAGEKADSTLRHSW